MILEQTLDLPFTTAVQSVNAPPQAPAQVTRFSSLAFQCHGKEYLHGSIAGATSRQPGPQVQLRRVPADASPLRRRNTPGGLAQTTALLLAADVSCICTAANQVAVSAAVAASGSPRDGNLGIARVCAFFMLLVHGGSREPQVWRVDRLQDCADPSLRHTWCSYACAAADCNGQNWQVQVGRTYPVWRGL
jgi:hypothetical protein